MKFLFYLSLGFIFICFVSSTNKIRSFYHNNDYIEEEVGDISRVSFENNNVS